MREKYRKFSIRDNRVSGVLIAKNTDGTEIIDSKGLKSVGSFLTDQVGSYDTTTHTTTSTSYVDVPSMTLIPFTIDRTASVLVLVTMVCESFLSGSGAEALIHVGGEVNDVQQVRIRVPPDDVKKTYTTYLLRKLPVTGDSPVEYTIKMQWRSLGTTRLEVQQRQISYMLFGS